MEVGIALVWSPTSPAMPGQNLPRVATDDAPPLAFLLPSVGGNEIIAVFDGGRISSDGGVLLAAAADKRIGLIDRMVAWIPDHRDPAQMTHTMAGILRPARGPVPAVIRMPITSTSGAGTRNSTWPVAACRRAVTIWPRNRPCHVGSLVPRRVIADREDLDRNPACSDMATRQPSSPAPARVQECSGLERVPMLGWRSIAPRSRIGRVSPATPEPRPCRTTHSVAVCACPSAGEAPGVRAAA